MDESLIILLVLGAILAFIAMPAFIFFMIGRSQRNKIASRVDALEYRLDAVARSMVTLGRKIQGAAERVEPAPSAAEVKVPPAGATEGFTFEEEKPEVPAPTPPKIPETPPGKVVSAPEVPPAKPVPPPMSSVEAKMPKPEKRTPIIHTSAKSASQTFEKLQSKQKPSGPTFEKLLATQWTTWLGAIAFLLSGVFLVKIGFDRGWFSPILRVTMAYLGGITLVMAGEYLRSRSFVVAQGVSAGGIAVLFAATMGANILYGFISVYVATFVILVITTVAVLLSLKSGIVVAIVGLLGGFTLPLLLRTEEPRIWALLGYLILIHAATSFVASRRSWIPLLGLSSLAMAGWGCIYATVYAGREPWAVGVLALMTILPFFFSKKLNMEKGEGGMLHAITFIIFFVILATSCQPQRIEGWVMLGIISLGVIFLSSKKPFHIVSYAGVGIILVNESMLFAAKPIHSHALVIIFSMGLLWTVGPYLRHWRSQQPVDNLVVSIISSLGSMALIYSYSIKYELPLSIGIISLLWGFLLVCGSIPLLLRRELPQSSNRIAALLGAATVLISAAVPMELERAWITVAWAIEIPILIMLDHYLKVPLLRRMAYVMAGIVTVRLVLNPGIVSYPMGDMPFFNWILYGYGIALLSFLFSGYRLWKQEHKNSAEIFFWGARLFFVVLVTLQLRHFFQEGSLKGPVNDVWEFATYVHAWFLIAFIFKAINIKFYSLKDQTASGIMGVISLGLLVFWVTFVLNPIWSKAYLGETPILNGLLYIYGLPILWCLIMAKWVHFMDPAIRKVYYTVAYILTGLLITLQVRHFFHSKAMHRGSMKDMEMYSYSAAWILLAIGTLIGGIRRRSKTLRYVSLAVMMLTTFKVFILDITVLSDFHRVLSFVGLGISLFAISMVYQKFVFTDSEGDGHE